MLDPSCLNGLFLVKTARGRLEEESSRQASCQRRHSTFRRNCEFCSSSNNINAAVVPQTGAQVSGLETEVSPDSIQGSVANNRQADAGHMHPDLMHSSELRKTSLTEQITQAQYVRHARKMFMPSCFPSEAWLGSGRDVPLASWRSRTASIPPASRSKSQLHGLPCLSLFVVLPAPVGAGLRRSRPPWSQS